MGNKKTCLLFALTNVTLPLGTDTGGRGVYINIYIYISIFMCVYVYMYIYLCRNKIYIHTHIQGAIANSRKRKIDRQIGI